MLVGNCSKAIIPFPSPLKINNVLEFSLPCKAMQTFPCLTVRFYLYLSTLTSLFPNLSLFFR